MLNILVFTALKEYKLCTTNFSSFDIKNLSCMICEVNGHLEY